MRADSWNAYNINNITVLKKKKRRTVRYCAARHSDYSHVSTCKAAVCSETDACLGVKRGKWSANWSNTRILSLLNALWCMNTNFTLCKRTTGRENAFQRTAFQFQWLITRFVGCFLKVEGFPTSSGEKLKEKDREIIFVKYLLICTQIRWDFRGVGKLKRNLIKIVKWPSVLLIRFNVSNAVTTCSILLFIIGL